AEAFKTDLDQLQREVRNVMDPSTYAVHLEKRVAEWRATFEKSKAPFLERIGNVSLSTSVVDFGSEVEAETETETETETMSIAHAAADSTAALQNAKPCENQRPEKPYRKGREIPILKFARKILDQNEAAVLKKAAAAGLRSARRALAIYKKLKYAVNPVTWTTIRGKETTLPVFQKYAVRAIEVAANRCQLSAADLEVSAQKFLADLMEAVPSAAHSAQTAPTFWDALQERIAGTSDRHLAEIIFPDGEVGESVLSDHEWSICENALSVLQPPDTQAPLFSALRQLTAPREFAKAFLIFARMVQGDTFPPKIANQFRKADSQLPIPQEEEGAPDDVAAAAADDSTAGKKPILDLLALVSQPPREMLAMAMEKLPTDVFSILRAKPVLGALDGFVKILDTRNAVNLKTIASLGASSILGFFRSSGSRTNLVQEILNILTSMKVPQTLNAKQREQLCVWAEKELPNALVASNLLSQADAQLAGCIFSLAIEKFFSVNGELVRQIAVAQEEFTKMAVFMEGGARQVEMFDLDTAIDLNLSMVESLQSHLRAVDHTDQAMADAVSAKRTKFERVKLALSQGEESEAIVEARRNVEHAKGWLERVFASNNRSQLAKDFLSTKMPRPSCLRARLYNQRRIMMVDFLKELYGPLDIDDNGEIHYCAEVDKYSRPSVSQVFDALTAYKRDLRLREKILDGRESIQSSDQIDEIRNREQIIMNIQLLFRETTNEVEGFPMEIWGPSSDDYFLLDTQLDLVLDAEDELGNELTKMRNKSPKAQAYIEKMSDASGGFDEAKCVAQVRASLESRNKVISMARHLLIEPIISALKKATALTALKAAKPLSSAVVRYGRDGKVQLIDSVPPMPLVRWAAETSDAPENVLGYSSLFPQNVEVTQQFMEVLEAFDSAGRPNQSGNLTLRDPFSPYARHADGMFVYKAANDEIKVRLLSDQEFAGYMELQKAGHFADGYLFHGNGRLVNGCTPPLDASLETLSQEEIMANQSLIEAKALRRRILEETSKAARSAAQLLRILNGEPTLDDLEAIFVPGRLNSEAIEPTISLIQTLVRQKTGREEIPGVDWNALRRSTLGSVSMAA
ncbi:MAG: hypothetical protein LBH53_00835, partial [Puniceicoccales bacterium]|nr:hypothetical protein [Puniceicoccales bacterium]